MLKMLYVTNIAAPYRVDFFNDLSKYCELTVLFERKKAGNREVEWYNNNFKFKSIFLKSKSVGDEASISLNIIKYLKKDFDFIILGGYSSPTTIIASLYMKFNNIPYILNADGGFINYGERKINKFIKTFFISSAKYWLSSGKETNKYLVYYGANEKNIYNFPFTSLKESDILKELISIDARKGLKRNFNIPYDKVILSIGQFIPRKGFDWMIEAYKDLDKNIGIYIIGGEPTEEYISLKNKYKMNNLHFIDFQSKDIIKKWYQLADLFVLPTREDIWGLVVNEALANGLPVITTNRCIAGLELVEDGKNGYIVNVEEMEHLYMKTNYLINNDQLLEKMRHESLQCIKKYSIENMSKVSIEILKDIGRNN